MAVTRSQLPEPPAMQPRGPSSMRTQLAEPAFMRPRSGTPNPSYRMRGIISGNHVYWWAGVDDTTGAWYQGEEEELPTDIVCVKEFKIV